MSSGRATWAIAVVLAVGIGAVVADDTATPAKRVHTLRDQLRNVSVGWPEAVAALAIVAFVYVYLGGSRENESIADAWFNVVRPTLDLQFAKVGAYQGPPRDRPLIKDSCFSYRVYSSGRRNCSGLLASLELRKRQDLLSIVLSSLGVITSQDKCTIEIPLEASTMEPFVLLLCRRRDEKRVRKTYSDVEQFAVRASQPAALKSIGISVLADTPEVVSELLDQRVLKGQSVGLLVMRRPRIESNVCSPYRTSRSVRLVVHLGSVDVSDGVVTRLVTHGFPAAEDAQH